TRTIRTVGQRRKLCQPRRQTGEPAVAEPKKRGLAERGAPDAATALRIRIHGLRRGRSEASWRRRRITVRRSWTEAEKRISATSSARRRGAPPRPAPRARTAAPPAPP